MSVVIVDQNERVGDFVAKGLRDVESVEDFGEFASIGIEKDGALIAGCVYNNMRTNGTVPFDMNIAFFAKNASWATRDNMETILDYPFEYLKLARITALVKKSNKKVKKLISGLGFQYEGKARLAWDGVSDAYIYGMTRADANNCLKTLKDKRNV